MSSTPDNVPEVAPDLDRMKDEQSSAFEKVRSDLENLKTVQQIEDGVLQQKPTT